MKNSFKLKSRIPNFSTLLTVVWNTMVVEKWQEFIDLIKTCEYKSFELMRKSESRCCPLQNQMVGYIDMKSIQFQMVNSLNYNPRWHDENFC